MLLWFFLIYSFLGYLLETLYAHIKHASHQSRKCLLLLPLCPVYGIGAAAILALPSPVSSRIWLLLPCAALTATAAEYAMALFYERVWRVSFWDYSGLPGCLHGRICLPFSCAWGVLGLMTVRLIHPLVQRFATGLPQVLLPYLAVLLLSDLLVTGVLLRRTGDPAALMWYA